MEGKKKIDENIISFVPAQTGGEKFHFNDLDFTDSHLVGGGG